MAFVNNRGLDFCFFSFFLCGFSFYLAEVGGGAGSLISLKHGTIRKKSTLIHLA